VEKKLMLLAFGWQPLAKKTCNSLVLE